MGFKGLTVNTVESDEAHIFAEDDAAFFKCIVGDGNLIFPYGDRFYVSVMGSNQIRVGSGLLAIQGHIGTIPANDYEDFYLGPGVSGVIRYDYLAATFETTGLHGVDDFKLEILADQSYTYPAYAQGQLDDGTTKVQFLLARIKMNGLAISGVEMLNTETMTLLDLNEKLNGKVRHGSTVPSDSFGNDGDIYIMTS